MINERAAEILNHVKADIRQYPDQFYMGKWDCGTTACIAGWICRRAGANKELHASILAPILLGMEANYLFYPIYWPRRLQIEYRNAPCNYQKAEIACQAIDAFIANPDQFGPQDI